MIFYVIDHSHEGAFQNQFNLIVLILERKTGEKPSKHRKTLSHETQSPDMVSVVTGTMPNRFRHPKSYVFQLIYSLFKAGRRRLRFQFMSGGSGQASSC